MTLRSILVFLTALAFCVSPALLPEFGGFDPELYPIPQIDPPVQPAGYAFAIWGVIYLWLLVMAGFGLWKRREDARWDAVRVPLIISFGIGAFWLPVAYVSAFWAFVMIFAMLVPAVAAMRRAPETDRWWLRAPVALFAGWLTAASFASLGLVGAGFGVLFGQVPWALIAILGALITAVSVHLTRPREWVYLTSVLWALIAIVVQNTDKSALVMWVAGAGALIIAALILRQLTPGHRAARPA